MTEANITIDLTEEDLQDLLNNETFQWIYVDETTGITVNVHLCKS